MSVVEVEDVTLPGDGLCYLTASPCPTSEEQHQYAAVSGPGAWRQATAGTGLAPIGRPALPDIVAVRALRLSAGRTELSAPH